MPASRSTIALLPIVLAVGCGGESQSVGPAGQGPGAVGPPLAAESILQTRSGSLFKASWRVAPDGARTPRGGQFAWGGCSFGSLRGETVLCASGNFFPSPGAPLLFADERCTEPVVDNSNNPSRGSKVFVPLIVPNSCPPESGFFEVDPAGAPLERLYQSDGRRCWLKDGPVGEQKYRLREIRNPRLLGRLVTGPAKDGWAPVTVETDDGAREFFGWRSASGESWCDFRVATDGKHRCLPVDASTDGVWGFSREERFSDAQCQQAAGAAVPSICERIGYVTTERGGGCGAGGLAVYQGGGRLESSFRRGSDGTCASASDTSVASYALGPEIPPSTFPEVKYAPGPGTGRLRPLYMTGMAHPTPLSGKFWDTLLGTPCDATGERCVPQPGVWVDSGYFSDAACTKELVAASSACLVTSGVAASSGFPGGAFRLLGRHGGGLPFVRDGSKCVPAQAEKIAGKVLVQAERLQEDDLVPITDATDP